MQSNRRVTGSTRRFDCIPVNREPFLTGSHLKKKKPKFLMPFASFSFRPFAALISIFDLDVLFLQPSLFSSFSSFILRRCLRLWLLLRGFVASSFFVFGSSLRSSSSSLPCGFIFISSLLLRGSSALVRR